MPAPFPIPPDSPNLRDTPIVSPLAFKYYPVSVVDTDTPARPVVAGSIEVGATAYDFQSPLVSPLAITKNFPGT